MRIKLSCEIVDGNAPAPRSHGRVVRGAKLLLKRATPFQLGIALAATLAIGAVGCRYTKPELKTESGRPMSEVIALTPNQIRLRMRAQVGPMCGAIEEGADEIIAGTTNRMIQRAALEWKIQAVPQMRAALFQPDPMTAMIDSWVLCCQMADYFENGPGKNAMGDSSSIATTTCRELEQTLTEIALAISVNDSDVEKVRGEVRKWASENPIKHSISGRETTLSRVLERSAAASFSTGEVIADMSSAVDDLNRRLEVYAQQVIEQARWESELLQNKILSEIPLSEALPLAKRAVEAAEQASGTASSLAPLFERALDIDESTPKMISAEREAVIKALENELVRTIQFLQEERATALTHLTAERTAALLTFGESAETQRKLFTRDLDRLATSFVDHAFLRAVQLALVVVVALYVGAISLLFITRRLFNRNPSNER